MQERDFKGVWIPREIWLDRNLNWSEKLLLVEIDSLAKNGECFASNAYFAEFFALSKDRISRLVTSLREKGYVEVEVVYKEGTKQVEKRVITPTGYWQMHRYPTGENTDTPLGENTEDNNTEKINTENKRERDKAQPKRFQKPTVEQVRAYCQERRNSIDAEEFVDFYESKGWLVGKTPMKDWKASVRTWERSRSGNRYSKPKKAYVNPDDTTEWPSEYF